MATRGPAERERSINSMTAKYFLITGLIVGLVIGGGLIYRKANESKYPFTTLELGFPVTLVTDGKFSDFYTWSGKVLISKQDYSRQNLEKIFAWYSHRHAAGTGTIILDLYTDKNNVDKNEFTGLPDPMTPRSTYIHNNAHYIRDERESGREYYWYDLDPVKRDKQETIVLRQ